MSVIKGKGKWKFLHLHICNHRRCFKRNQIQMFESIMDKSGVYVSTFTCNGVVYHTLLILVYHNLTCDITLHVKNRWSRIFFFFFWVEMDGAEYVINLGGILFTKNLGRILINIKTVLLCVPVILIRILFSINICLKFFNSWD